MAAVAEQKKSGRLNARMSGLYRKLFFGATLFSVVVLAVINLMTAFAVVTVTHQTRVQYARLQTLEHERDAFQANWSRLLLEESTWSSPSRIEAIAQQRLQMKVPAADATRVLKP